MRECDACCDYRRDLRGMRRSFAALAPIGAGPLALVAKLLGGGGAAAAGGGGGAALVGGAGAATACKVAAAVVCATAITAGGAVEVDKLTHEPAQKRERKAEPNRGEVRAAAAAAHTSPARASVAARPVPAHSMAAPARSVAAPAPRRDRAVVARRPRTPTRSSRRRRSPRPTPATTSRR